VHRLSIYVNKSGKEISAKLATLEIPERKKKEKKVAFEDKPICTYPTH